MAKEHAAKVDLSDRNSSRTLIVELVGRDKRVLGIGSAGGSVAEALVQRGCRVTSIETDSEAAKRAEEHCERVIIGDVENIDLEEELGGESFKIITFAGVLEHLKDPIEVLRRLKPFLHPEGQIVASIPNAAHSSMRLAPIQGQYRPLDDTHSRFFTRESVERLFNEAGFVVSKLETSTAQISDTEAEVDREAVPEEVPEMIQNEPELETYKFVLAAHPSGYAGQSAELSDRVRLLSEQLGRRDRLIYELNRRLRNLQEMERRLEDRDRRLVAKEKEVTELTQRLTERNHELVDSWRTVENLNNQLEQAQRGNR